MHDIYTAVQHNIETAGQHLFGVGSDGNDPAFIYTIGNALHGLPELLCIGNFPPHIMGLALNTFGKKMREEKQALPEGFVSLTDWPLPFKVRKAGGDVRDRFTIQAGQFYGHENYDVLQVMICDKTHHYPGDIGCDPYYDVEQP